MAKNQKNQGFAAIRDVVSSSRFRESRKHRGHKVSIVSYGDWDNPEDVCLECEDCGEVVLDAEIYTLCAREDF